MDRAQCKNSSGYGVAWHEDGETKAYTTLNYIEFKEFLKTKEDFELVIHLRNTTAGDDSLDNCHPFAMENGGYMFHNGTLFDFKSFKSDASDTANFAQTLNQSKYDHISDIAPLVQELAGYTLNRLVFIDETGKIDIINEDLGIWEGNTWYSNDYHLPPQLTNIFVYGTLKFGYSNHDRHLLDAEYIADATTTDKWAMIGKDYYFPYLLRKHAQGHHVEGEIYAVTDAQLKALDRLEGHPTHYRKTPITVTTLSGKKLDVTTYTKTSIHKALWEEEFISTF